MQGTCFLNHFLVWPNRLKDGILLLKKYAGGERLSPDEELFLQHLTADARDLVLKTSRDEDCFQFWFTAYEAFHGNLSERKVRQWPENNIKNLLVAFVTEDKRKTKKAVKFLEALDAALQPELERLHQRIHESMKTQQNPKSGKPVYKSPTIKEAQREAIKHIGFLSKDYL